MQELIDTTYFKIRFLEFNMELQDSFKSQKLYGACLYLSLYCKAYYVMPSLTLYFSL